MVCFGHWSFMGKQLFIGSVWHLPRALFLFKGTKGLIFVFFCFFFFCFSTFVPTKWCIMSVPDSTPLHPPFLDLRYTSADSLCIFSLRTTCLYPFRKSQVYSVTPLSSSHYFNTTFTCSDFFFFLFVFTDVFLLLVGRKSHSFRYRKPSSSLWLSK